MTARPAVHPFTDRLYESLPEFRRLADPDLDWPLLRYLSLLVDQAGTVVDLIDRITYTPPDDAALAAALGIDITASTSDLTDPATADAAWLPWLAQFVGANISGLTVDEARDAIPGVGFLAGTKRGIAQAAAAALIGTKYVRVYDHYTGDPWLIEVRVRASETVPENDPAGDAKVRNAILARHAKPAGYDIVVTHYHAPWDDIEALGSWNAVEARGSWDLLEETGLP